jgi:hypothetical protein
MNSLQKSTGDKLGALAKKYQQQHGGSYESAWMAVKQKHPDLALAWATGTVSQRNYAELGPLELAMLRAQNDAAWVKRRAGEVVDHHARLRADQGRVGPVSGVLGHSQALQDIRSQNPELAAAEESGYIASDGWALLALLDPGVSSLVKARGVEPMQVQGVYQSSERSHVYRDASNNEVRKYVL